MAIFRFVAPDPSSLEAWRANLIPADADARAWWLCSLLSHVAGKPVLDELELELATEPSAIRA